MRAWCPETVVITTAHFLWDVRCAFPRQGAQGHAWSPHGSHDATGLAITAAGDPGRVCRGIGYIREERSGWQGGGILEPYCGSGLTLKPLGFSFSLGYTGSWL